MRHSDPGRSGGLRLAGFLLLAALVLKLMNLTLVTTDTSRALMMEELQRGGDFDVAFVGSSPVYYSIDPEIVRRTCGLRAIDAAIGNAGLESCQALTRAALRYNSLQYVVVTLEPDMLLETRENPEAEIRVMPWLHHPLDRLAYLADLCRGDDRWMTRLFYFRAAPVASLEEWIKTASIRFRLPFYREKMNAELEDTPYLGAGYHEMRLSPPEGGLLAHREFFTTTDHLSLFPPLTMTRLQEMQRVCTAHGARLIVLIPPCLLPAVTSSPRLVEACEAAEQFCGEEGICFFNMMKADRERLPSLDDRYVDIYHFDREGAALYSRFMGEFLLALSEGRDVSGWFRETL